MLITTLSEKVKRTDRQRIEFCQDITDMTSKTQKQLRHDTLMFNGEFMAAINSEIWPDVILMKMLYYKHAPSTQYIYIYT